MKNVGLFLVAILLMFLPFILQNNVEFSGTDDQAKNAITEIEPEYQPWFESFYKPSNGKIESLLFSLQIALGAIVIGYILGFVRAKKIYSTKQDHNLSHDKNR